MKRIANNKQDFFTYLEIQKGIKLTYDYPSRLNMVLSYFNGRPYTELNLRTFFQYLHNKGLAPNTINNYLKLFRHIDRYLHVEVSKEFTYKHINIRVVSCLSPQEIKDLANVDDNIRISVAIWTLALTGMRINELRLLEWDHVQADQITITSENSKNNIERIIPITDFLYQKLQLLANNKSIYVFGTDKGKIDDNYFRYELHKRADIIGLHKRIYPHLFRHSFVTTLIQQGEPLEKIALIVGHTDYNTTYKTYMHLASHDLLRVIENHPLVQHHLPMQRIKQKIIELACTFFNVTENDVTISRNKSILDIKIRLA